MTITHRRVETNGVTLHLAEAGEGPLVVLLHGFPESWYSYRHQLEALAAAGYHAVAPDQRGYGQSSAPHEIDQYAMPRLVGDVVGMIDALGETRCAVVGHDWGSPVASTLGLFRPDLVRGVALLSVPYTPRGEQDMLSGLTQRLGPDNYQAFFQEPGVAEAALGADVRATMLRMLVGLSGDAAAVATGSGADVNQPADATETNLPSWLSEADVDFFTAEFERSGFRGPLNWYRNSVLNWEMTAAWHNVPLRLPSLYVGGDRDLVLNWPGFAELVAALGATTMPGLTRAVVLEGCGHWTQQERPEDVNALLLEFLRALGD
jgi:pimeloyl-ACP methyl ester carboxylesterase